MASIREIVLVNMLTMLTGATSATVQRSRTLPVPRVDAPIINILPVEEADEPLSAKTMRHHLTVAVTIAVRGDPFDSIADPIASAIHPILTNLNNYTAKGIASVRSTSTKWEAHEGDLSVGEVAIEYLVTFATNSNDITVLF